MAWPLEDGIPAKIDVSDVGIRKGQRICLPGPPADFSSTDQSGDIVGSSCVCLPSSSRVPLDGGGEALPNTAYAMDHRKHGDEKNV